LLSVLDFLAMNRRSGQEKLVAYFFAIARYEWLNNLPSRRADGGEKASVSKHRAGTAFRS
jgi:hypothetical protein